MKNIHFRHIVTKIYCWENILWKIISFLKSWHPHFNQVCYKNNKLWHVQNMYMDNNIWLATSLIYQLHLLVLCASLTITNEILKWFSIKFLLTSKWINTSRLYNVNCLLIADDTVISWCKIKDCFIFGRKAIYIKNIKRTYKLLYSIQMT